MRVLECPSALNVAVGQTFHQDLPVGGLVYEGIQFDMSDIAHSEITNIRVLVNGREVMFFASGTDLQNLNDYYGYQTDNDTLQIFFNTPAFKELPQQRLTGIPTAGLQSLVVTGDIDAGATGAALSTRRFVSSPNAENKIDTIKKVKRFPFTAAASGQQELTNLTLGARIMAMHFINDGVTRVDIEDQSFTVMEATKVTLDLLHESYGRVPQTSVMTTVDFCIDGDLGNALVTTKRDADNVNRARALRFLPTIDAAESMPAYVEYLDLINNL